MRTERAAKACEGLSAGARGQGWRPQEEEMRGRWENTVCFLSYTDTPISLMFAIQNHSEVLVTLKLSIVQNPRAQMFAKRRKSQEIVSVVHRCFSVDTQKNNQQMKFQSPHNMFMTPAWGNFRRSELKRGKLRKLTGLHKCHLLISFYMLGLLEIFRVCPLQSLH